MVARIRSGLIAMVYRHTTTLRAVDVQYSAALALMGTDVERIVQALRFVHEVWASIPEVAIAIWLLARQVSCAALMPLAVCLGQFFLRFIPLSLTPQASVCSSSHNGVGALLTR